VITGVRRRPLRRIRATCRGTARQDRRPRTRHDEDSTAETIDELQTRIREAARHMPLERLALSPQCGFSTSILGNALTAVNEQAKLRTIVATAEHVWDNDHLC
jgi:hypothetical protein